MWTYSWTLYGLPPAVILCPHTPSSLHPRTKAWIEAHGGLLVDVGRSETAYWELLSSHWNLGTDLIIIEHDIVPRGACYEDMVACWHPWCTAPYVVHWPEVFTEDHSERMPPREWILYHSLGMARFSAALQRLIPDAWDQVAGAEMVVLGQEREMDQSKNWHGLDGRLDHVLMKAGYQPHPHFPGPEHIVAHEDATGRTVDTWLDFEAARSRRGTHLRQATDLGGALDSCR